MVLTFVSLIEGNIFVSSLSVLRECTIAKLSLLLRISVDVSCVSYKLPSPPPATVYTRVLTNSVLARPF